MGKSLFLSAKITGDPEYQEKFEHVTAYLQKLGYDVMNPAVLPETGFTHSQYMHVTFAMQDVCEISCFMPDRIESGGAIMEFVRAIIKRKIILFYIDVLAGNHEQGGVVRGVLHSLRALRRNPRPGRAVRLPERGREP